MTEAIGYWKMNVSLLHDDSAKNYVQTKVKDELERKKHLQPIAQWTSLKSVITKLLQGIARRSAGETNTAIAQLKEFIAEKEETFPLIRKDYDLYVKSKNDLQDLIEERTQALIFRSKVQWYEGGEKCSRYFFNMEKIRSSNKTCQLLIRDDGSTAETLPEIIKEQTVFYRKLYSCDRSVIFDYTNLTDIKLSPTQYQQLNEPLNQQELKTAVEKLSKEKSPGPDGFPVEIFQILWNEIGDLIFKVYSQVFEEKQMFNSAMQGVLNLIPKQNKDTCFLKNLRPITLLNVEYKIIEKVIAMRIQSMLDSIIHPDQAGFMAGRQASTNVRKIMDIIQYCENENVDGALLCLDYMKAFDRVELMSILSSLHFFNYPPFITEWIKILYTGFQVRIQNNGFFSEYIDIERSVHQGGCASAFLYIILAETLAISIRSNTNIKGINVGDTEHKLNQFADNTSLASQFNQDSLDEILSNLTWFQNQSGLLISYDKTSLYRISAMKMSNAKLCTKENIRWEEEGVNILGI